MLWVWFGFNDGFGIVVVYVYFGFVGGCCFRFVFAFCVFVFDRSLWVC